MLKICNKQIQQNAIQQFVNKKKYQHNHLTKNFTL